MPGKKPTHTGRDATKEATGIKHEISIHAPHTGRDNGYIAYKIFGGISIHAPHTGRDGNSGTLLADSIDFNPRAPYGARLISWT